MAIHSTTVDWDNINSITRANVMPKVYDQIFRSNAFFQSVRRGMELVSGGTMLSVPLLYGEGPGGAYSGAETLDTTDTEIITRANYAWKWYYASATVLRQDELMNSGSLEQVVKYVTVKLQTMRKTMANLLGTGLYSDGQGNAKLITGIGAMIDGTGAGAGITYGGIAKSTNTWWQAIVDNTTATLSLKAMRKQKGKQTEDTEKPNMLLTTQDIHDNYWGLLQPQQRFMDSSLARGGFTNILFEGSPLIVDSHCPDNKLYFLNTNYIHFKTHRQENMRFRPFMEQPQAPQVRSAFIFWGGNLCGSNCRFQGVMNALTA